MNPITRFLISIPIIGRFVVIPLLEAGSGKTRRMPNERGEVVPKKLLIGRILRFFLFLFAAVIFAVVYYSFFARGSGEGESRPINGASEIAGQIEGVFTGSSEADLVNVYRTLSFDALENLPTAVSKLRQQIKIAEQLTKSPNATTRVQGKTFSLKSYLNLAMVYLREDAPITQPTREGLQKLIETNSPADDSTIDSLQLVANSLLQFDKIQKLQKDKTDSTELAATFDAFSSEFQQAAVAVKNDMEAASLLSQLAKIFEDDGNQSSPAMDKVLTAISDNFLTSELKPVKDLGIAWDQHTVAQSMALPGDNPAGPQSSNVELRNKLIEILKTDDFSQEKWKQVTKAIESMWESGDVESVAELLEICLAKIEKKPPENSTIGPYYKLLSVWMNLLNTKFDVAGLKDAFGNDVSFGDEKFPINILIYGTPYQKRMMTEYIFTIQKLIGAKMEQKQVALSIIYTIADASTFEPDQSLKSDMKFASQKDTLNLWILDPKSPSGEKHFEKYPKVVYPFVILLDKEMQIISVNPNRIELERLVAIAFEENRTSGDR